MKKVFLKFFEFHNWNGNGCRFDSLVLIVYNYFIIFLIANKDVEWSFHPFKNDIIADKYGLLFNKPTILPKFGLVFRCLTIGCNLFGLIPVIIPKRKYREYIMPVLVWNVYTVTALVVNLLQLLISIISLEVPWKAICSISISGLFVATVYMKLILQLINFYEQLHLAK